MEPSGRAKVVRAPVTPDGAAGAAPETMTGGHLAAQASTQTDLFGESLVKTYRVLPSAPVR